MVQILTSSTDGSIRQWKKLKSDQIAIIKSYSNFDDRSV